MYYQTIIESGFYLYFLLLEYKNVLKLDDFEIEWNEDYVSQLIPSKQLLKTLYKESQKLKYDLIDILPIFGQK